MNVEIYGDVIEIDSSFVSEGKDEIQAQVRQFLDRERNEFDLETKFPENFTGEVMQQISRIDYSETVTYGEIAEDLDSSPIAVGQACGRNPVPVIVPCHRVVGKSSLGGYIGGRELKKKLLELESGN